VALDVVGVAMQELLVLLEALLQLLPDHLVAPLLLEMRCRQGKPTRQRAK
jgi:hypothetical protein